MKQTYASSLYSQKSAKSSKSVRSYLSLGNSIFKVDDNASITSSVRGYLKSWLPRKPDTLSRLKGLFSKNKSSPEPIEDSIHSSTDNTLTTTDSVIENYTPRGILVNRENESAEAIEERRRKRRESMLRRYHYNTLDHETSSSDTLLEEERVKFEEERRIVFVERSPVPRFRNEPPRPPPSPPYMSIFINNHEDKISVIKSPTFKQDTHIVYTQRQESEVEPVLGEQERRIQLLMESLNPAKKHKLRFKKPYYRGQTLQFSLQNTLPEDHIVLFKFMTSNTHDTIERYLVKPSAGRLDTIKRAEISLFLNKVPQELKDKIMIRWAVVQRDRGIEDWIDHNLQEHTRRRWIELMEEHWSDQVSIKMTRIKVEFI